MRGCQTKCRQPTPLKIHHPFGPASASTAVVGQKLPSFMPFTTVFGRLSRVLPRPPRLSGRNSRVSCHLPRFSGDFPEFCPVYHGCRAETPEFHAIYHGFRATFPSFAPFTTVDGQKLPSFMPSDVSDGTKLPSFGLPLPLASGMRLYSSLNASTGSVRAARRTGTYVPTSAISIRTT